MELRDALRTTPATRTFTDAPVDDATIAGILDDARFAPSGGNRQAWRVVVLKDPTIRRAVRDLYLAGWYEYLGQVQSGMTPFGVYNDQEQVAIARSQSEQIAKDAAAGPGGFAEHLDEVPALLLVLADISALATVDRDLDRYSFAGGASLYPFVWNILLAARDRGLGGVITTMNVRNEPALLELLGAPERTGIVALVALGEPSQKITKLKRSQIHEFTTIDSFDGPTLSL